MFMVKDISVYFLGEPLRPATTNLVHPLSAKEKGGGREGKGSHGGDQFVMDKHSVF